MKLTVTQYADVRGISRQAVIKAIKKGHNMEGVDKVDVFGYQYVITTTINWTKKNKKKLSKYLEVVI